MSLQLPKSLRASAIMTGLFACAISISACQQQSEPEPSLDEDIAAEQAVPMSAEPAEPNDTVVAPDASLSAVQDDTLATVNTDVSQQTYICSPELKIEVTYKEDANEAVLVTNMGTVTTTRTNEGSNPEIYEADTNFDGTAGLVEWRVAHGERETGVMRTTSGESGSIATYECNKTGASS